MYVFDFFGNGTIEQIITFYKHGVSYPLATRDEMVKLMPPLRSKYPSYASFGASRVADIFPADELSKAKVLYARTFASSVAIAQGTSGFALRSLPIEAQFAPVYASLARDMNGDGTVDLLLAGNFIGAPPMLGRSDASEGVFLRGAGDGSFASMSPSESGVRITGESRRMQVVRQAGGKTVVVVARNNRPLQFLRVTP
jgi:enediyne biosynthesis protein E4